MPRGVPGHDLIQKITSANRRNASAANSLWRHDPGHDVCSARGDRHRPPLGRILNANLAEHLIPVSADVPGALMIEEHDPHTLGIKGVGENGHHGSAGAVANTV
jgi:hypothetical protein